MYIRVHINLQSLTHLNDKLVIIISRDGFNGFRCGFLVYIQKIIIITCFHKLKILFFIIIITTVFMFNMPSLMYVHTYFIFHKGNIKCKNLCNFPKKTLNQFYFVLHSHWFKLTILQLIYRFIFLPLFSIP